MAVLQPVKSTSRLIYNKYHLQNYQAQPENPQPTPIDAKFKILFLRTASNIQLLHPKFLSFKDFLFITKGRRVTRILGFMWVDCWLVSLALFWTSQRQGFDCLLIRTFRQGWKGSRRLLESGRNGSKRIGPVLPGTQTRINQLQQSFYPRNKCIKHRWEDKTQNATILELSFCWQCYVLA